MPETMPGPRLRGRGSGVRPYVWIVVVAAVVAAATGVVVRQSPPALAIVIAEARSGRSLWIGEVPGTAAVVEVRYLHTVERTPVIEVFTAEADGLRFVEMRFVSQGAGLPTEGYVRKGDVFVLRRPGPTGVLRLAVSASAGHELLVAGRRVDLVALAGDGASVTVTSRPAAPRLPWTRPRPNRL